MERPSHIDFNTHQSLPHRLPLIGLAISLQIAVFWLISHGLGGRVIHFDPGPIEFVRVHDPETPPLAPPVPPLKTVLPPTVPVPVIAVDPGQDGNAITATMTPGRTTAPQAGMVVRAPVSIPSTHTVPPYPVIARRVGVEGKVMLRLTVLVDGHVGKAEIVTSSGREDMDQAAQQWIVAHWRYRPAVDNGVPAAGQAFATVVFSLTDAK